MAINEVQSATSLRLSPVDDRKKRMRAYSTAMSIRTACFVLVFFVPGWWKLVFGIGAVVLPYIAVVLANAGSSAGTSPISPGLQMNRLELEERPAAGWSSTPSSEWTAEAAGEPRREQAQWQHREAQPQWQSQE